MDKSKSLCKTLVLMVHCDLCDGQANGGDAEGSQLSKILRKNAFVEEEDADGKDGYKGEVQGKMPVLQTPSPGTSMVARALESSEFTPSPIGIQTVLVQFNFQDCSSLSILL